MISKLFFAFFAMGSLYAMERTKPGLIDITGLSKRRVLQELFKRARPSERILNDTVSDQEADYFVN